MVSIVEEEFRFVDEVFLQVGNFATDAHGAEGGFAADVGVGGGDDGLDFGEEVAGHFDAGDVAEGAEGEADDVLVGVVKVAIRPVSIHMVPTKFGSIA